MHGCISQDLYDETPVHSHEKLSESSETDSVTYQYTFFHSFGIYSLPSSLLATEYPDDSKLQYACGSMYGTFLNDCRSAMCAVSGLCKSSPSCCSLGSEKRKQSQGFKSGCLEGFVTI